MYPGVWRARRSGKAGKVTPDSSRLIAPAKMALATLPVIASAPISVSGAITARGCLLTLPLKGGELVYGFGLQLLSMECRGKKRTLRVNADPKIDTGDSHAPVPFYVTSEGYGVLIDTARSIDVYVDDAKPKPTRPLPLKPSGVIDPQYSHELAEADRGRVLVDVPHAKGVDVYLIAGPSMLQAVQRYNLFSGGGVLPPEWGLGFWYRGDGHSDQKAIVALAEEFRRREIPCDVLGLEPGWQSHAYSCSYVWDSSRFPEPEALLRQLADLQMKTNLWEHAFTHPSSPIFSELLAHSGDYGVWGGLVPDLQGEAARNIFGDYHGKKLIDMGVSGFKLDECDSSDFTGGWSFPNASSFASGVDGEQMHAFFGLRYQHTLYEQFPERNQKTYGLVRSSGALAAPYPFVLYSDLYDHRQFVRGVVTASFSGLLWCPEVRDAKDPEDLIRRLQSVVFSPLAMVNGWYIKNPPWKQIDRKLNNADEFTKGWEELEGRCREIIGWRMQLIPYLLSAFHKYAVDGTPPFRALVLDYTDGSLKRVDDQYMVGDRMMVAPLFYGETTREVVLPPGTWHDFWTGKTFAGEQRCSSQRRNGTFRCLFDIRIPIYSTREGDWIDARCCLQGFVCMQVYGDGSLPWSLDGTGNSAIALTWDHAVGSGRVAGTGGYRVVDWKHMG